MKATITITDSQTRILVRDEMSDLVLAQLPPLSSAAHLNALPTLLQSLALWCSHPLHVVLFVDELFDWQQSGLSDALLGESLFYQVEVVPLQHAHHRPKRLAGLGNFARERAIRRRFG